MDGSHRGGGGVRRGLHSVGVDSPDLIYSVTTSEAPPPRSYNPIPVFESRGPPVRGRLSTDQSHHHRHASSPPFRNNGGRPLGSRPPHPRPYRPAPNSRPPFSRPPPTATRAKKSSSPNRGVISEVLLFKENFVESIAALCGRWGGYVFDHPYKVSILSVLVAAFSVVGLLPGVANWLDGAETLYALPHTQAKNDGLVHNSLFSDSLTLANFIIVTSDPPGRNILTWEDLHFAWQVDQLVRGKLVDPALGRRIALPAQPEYLPGITATSLLSSRYSMRPLNHTYGATAVVSPWGRRDSPTEGSRYESGGLDKGSAVMTYEHICAINPHGKCAVNSIFEMGILDMKKILPPGAPPELLVLGGNVFNTDKKGFVPDYLLGGAEIVPCTRELPTALLLNFYEGSQLRRSSNPSKSIVDIQCVVKATAFQMVYEVDDRAEFLPRNAAWMELMYSVMSDNRNFGPLLVGANAFKSRDDELRKSTSESQDLIFVVFTFILVISYTAAINFSCDLYKNRAVTALFGSLSTLFGILAGFGYTSMMGVSFVPTALVTPFLVMGVGCDDVFVIINSYALAYCEPTPRDRCIVTFKDCGVSVILTTATNLIAFGVGCQSPYISIRNFCLFSLNGLAFSLFFELTLFYAVLCLDAQREADRRSCFCVKEEEIENVDADIRQQDHKVKKSVATVFGQQRLSTFELVNYQVGNDWATRSRFTPKIDGPPPARRFRKNLFLRLVDRFVDAGNWLHPPAHNDPVYRILDRSQSHPDGEGDMAAVTMMMTRGVGFASRKKLPTSHCLENPGANSLILASSHPAFTREPKGNVGRAWRSFFSNVFCVCLLHPVTKVVVLLVFGFVFGLAVRGILAVEQGLELKDLSPDRSYLKVYDHLYKEFFSGYDIPVYIFFPEPTPWWEPRVQRTLKIMDERLSSRNSTRFLNDPLTRMLIDRDLKPRLTTGDRALFEATLYDALSTKGSKWKQFEKDFAWEGRRLVGWKVTILPAGMSTSEQRAQWMRTIRTDVAAIKDLAKYEPGYYPLRAIVWNYMMVFYESDLQIMSSVISSMTTAAISMLVVALILIPEVSSGLLVIFVMSLIDIAVMGFMYYWDVKLNMISMITLVISIGFSIDYSAHICHTFTHCLGRTRNLRAVECVVLMGTPVFHGAASTIVGIMVLGYSQSFIFRLFFKMLILVLVFGILHGLVLLPVLLSLIGKMPGPRLHSDQIQLNTLSNIETGTGTGGSFGLEKPFPLKHSTAHLQADTLRAEPALHRSHNPIYGMPNSPPNQQKQHHRVGDPEALARSIYLLQSAKRQPRTHWQSPQDLNSSPTHLLDSASASWRHSNKNLRGGSTQYSIWNNGGPQEPPRRSIPTGIHQRQMSFSSATSMERTPTSRNQGSNHCRPIQEHLDFAAEEKNPIENERASSASRAFPNKTMQHWQTADKRQGSPLMRPVRSRMLATGSISNLRTIDFTDDVNRHQLLAQKIAALGSKDFATQVLGKLQKARELELLEGGSVPSRTPPKRIIRDDGRPVTSSVAGSRISHYSRLSVCSAPVTPLGQLIPSASQSVLDSRAAIVPRLLRNVGIGGQSVP